MCTRGHVFFTEMKSFDPDFGSPKMENVSSYIMFLILLNFQLIRKCWYAEKKKSSDVLPHALEENLDALSSMLLYSCFHFLRLCLKYRYICLPGEC